MDAKKQTVLTLEGLEKLENELEELKTKTRKDLADKIKKAIAFGDLSENSEFDEAKNEQALVEERIAKIEAILKNAKIIDSNELTDDLVQIGSKVKIEDLTYNEVVEYRIVGSMEADPSKGRISDESPVGKSLLGHRVGEEVKAKTPLGVSKIKIVEISR